MADETERALLAALPGVLSQDPEVHSGDVVFAGTRVPVAHLLDHIPEGEVDNFLLGYPTVSLTQVLAVLEVMSRTSAAAMAAVAQEDLKRVRAMLERLEARQSGRAAEFEEALKPRADEHPAIGKAREAGIDIRQLRALAWLTPTERLRRLDAMLELRGVRASQPVCTICGAIPAVAQGYTHPHWGPVALCDDHTRADLDGAEE